MMEHLSLLVTVMAVYALPSPAYMSWYQAIMTSFNL